MVRKPILVVLVCCLVAATASAQRPGLKEHKRAKKWFRKQEWLQGGIFKPEKGMDYDFFYAYYNMNPAAWQKAFAFIKNTNLDSLPKGKYPIDGDNVFASVTEDPTKDFDKTNWESHRKYCDLQIVVSGTEKMGRCQVSLATVTKPYDEKKDVANYSATGDMITVTTHHFMIFTPSEAHRPNITPGGNKVVKKCVIKVKVGH